MPRGERFLRHGQALPAAAFLTALLSVSILFGGLRGAGPAPSRTSFAVRGQAASSSVLYVPASAHAAGANGASWRTDLEVHNPGSASASFTVHLLVRDADNAAPQSKSYTLGPNQSRRFTDVLLSEFGFTGAAALRVVASTGSLLVTSRTYNLVGTNPWSLPEGASFGQFVPGFAETQAIGYGQEGRLIHLTQLASATLTGFRTNLGLVNTTPSAIDVRVDLYRSDGSWLGKKDGAETNLPSYGFRQLNELFAAWGTVSDGYAVVKTTTVGGGLLAFATVIDNHSSGDPVFVPAAVLLPAAAPTPTPTATLPPSTPTPTRTPTPTPTVPASGQVDLVPYKPAGWENPLVPDATAGSLTTSFLSAHMNTYVRWAVLNTGPADITSAIRFELRIDGVRYTGWRNDSGLRAGYYTYVEDFPIPYDTLTVGSHTLSIVADQDGVIAETNEANNSWGKSWEWSSIVFRPPDGASNAARPAADADDLPLPPARPASKDAVPVPLAAPTPIWIPASAHASGLNGASWRTDVEVHNPGTTAAGFTIALMKQATDNGGSVPTRSFSLGPQQSVRYADILSTVFGTDGAAALRITPTAGTILANSRTYNLIGANSVGLPVGASFSQFVPGLAESEAIGDADEGRIIELTHRDAATLADFRSNLGFVNATATPIDLRVDLMSADGGLLATIQDERTRLRAHEFKQINGVFGEFTSWLADGYVIVRTMTGGGRFFAFATVIDNHLTGDPICIPAAKLARAPIPTPTPTPTPTPGADVVTGPGGTQVALPQARTTGATVSIASADAAGIVDAGETLASTTVQIAVSGSEPMVGSGAFSLTIPVTGAVSDPSKLLVKVLLVDGRSYPVAGVWDAARRSLTAPLMGLWNRWKAGVVVRPDLTRFAPPPPPGPLGWVTPDDWKSCSFTVVNHAPTVPAAFATGTLPSTMARVCSELRSDGFRSPKLWLDTRPATPTRYVHLVRGVKQQNAPPPIGSHFESCDPQDAACDETNPAFRADSLTAEQMLSLGQVYINYDELQTLGAAWGVDLGNIAVHELYHAVRRGYDFRRRADAAGSSDKAYMEGPATVVGHTYQGGGTILGAEILLRSWKPPLPLDERLDDYRTGPYLRQDFFAYVAKRFSPNDLTPTRWLFQDMSDQTDGKFGLSHEDYLGLYCRATDFWLAQAWGKGLSEVYGDFVLDRAYRHPEYARLRSTERALPAGSFDKNVFTTDFLWDPAAQRSFSFPELAPLASATAAVTVPASSATAGSLSFRLAVSGAPLAGDGVRVTVFREKAGVMVSPQGEITVTDASQPLTIPVGPDVDRLRIVVSNASLEARTAKVTLGDAFARLSLGTTNFSFACTQPPCDAWCGVRAGENGLTWVSPLAWNGASFVYEKNGAPYMGGTLSPDGKTLLTFYYDIGVRFLEWRNLPIDPSRSNAEQSVFAVSGEAARDHVVVAVPMFCDTRHSGIDWLQPVNLEIWLAR